MYLELADGYELADNYSLADDITQYYVSIPTDDGGIVNVREDMLDDLPYDQWEYIIDMQPMMNENCGMGDKAARRARRSARKEKRASKQEARTRRRETRTERAEARTERSKAGDTTFNRILNATKETATSIFGGGSAPTQSAPAEKGLNVQAGYSKGFNWGSPVVIIGGVLLIGGIAIAIASRQKKK